VQCRACSLVYTNEIPSRGDIDVIYDANYYDKGVKYAELSKSVGLINAEQRVTRLLLDANIKRDRWLDVGCATGEFISEARHKVKEVCGVEISVCAIKIAKERGIEGIIVGDFFDTEWEHNYFDLISMWDVIEHLPDPVSNLKHAFQLIKPGGFLVLSTGDITSITARLFGRFWHLMTPPEHQYFFSPATIKQMLSSCGFNLVSIEHNGKRVPLDFMVQKVTRLLYPPATKRVLQLATRLELDKIVPVINFGDIMEITALKPLNQIG
jgi:ubiquinone/menaquinone biosynthesis C-methylase UbiE